MPNCQPMPKCTGSAYAILCPRMPSQAEHIHTKQSCALLSCASPGCAKPRHAKLGPR